MRYRTAALWIALFVIAIGAEEGESSLEVKNETFTDNNGTWSEMPAFTLIKALGRKWSVSWEQELDVVSGASRRLGLADVGKTGDSGSVDVVSGASHATGVVQIGPDTLDVVSGASRQAELRYSENPGVTYSHAGVTASGFFYTSREDDYTSYSPAASFSWDFNQRNTTLAADYAEFFDDFHPTGAFAGEGGRKRIRNLDASLNQILTPLTMVALTAGYNDSWGYLGHPYNPPMDSNGALMLEAVPDTKVATALGLQCVQGYHLGDHLGSLNFDMRNTQDDWGLRSSAADLKLSQHFTEDAYLQLRARYYQQTGADFAKKYYAGDEVYRTADIRLFPFKSLLLGFKLSASFPESWQTLGFLPATWDIKWDHLIRNTHGDPVPVPGQPRTYLYQFYAPDAYYHQDVIMTGLVFKM